MTTVLISILLADAQPGLLQSHPDVARVEVTVQCESPRLTIVHVRDWHFVGKQSFALDVRDESEKPLSDAGIDVLHQEHRRTVAVVQKQQRRVMQALVKQHGIRQVYQEGLTAEELPAYKRHIAALKKIKPFLSGDDPLDQLIRHEYQTDLLTLGASGQLLIDGHIESVQPVDEAEAYKAADPIKPDGRIVFDEEASEARENAIVRNLMKASDRLAVVVLGGGHKLSDNVPDSVRLVEVTVKAYPGP